MTPPTDSLVAALRAVPLKCATCHESVPQMTIHVCNRPLLMADYPALAAAAQEWIRAQIPGPFADGPFDSRDQLRENHGYNAALTDVAGRLGL